MSESYDQEAVIERLMQEVRQAEEVLTLAKSSLHSDRRYEKLTLIGGIKALLRDLHAAEEDRDALRREIDRRNKASGDDFLIQRLKRIMGDDDGDAVS